MAINNNTAGRLHDVLQRLQNSPNGQRSKLAAALQVSDNWESILPAIIALKQEHLRLEETIAAIDDKRLYALYSGNLKDVNESLNNINLDMKGATYSIDVIPTAVVALKFLAHHHPVETTATPDD